MTLRLRLVVALTSLVAVGLAVFGAVTYALYAQSEYQRLDDQLRGTAPALTQELLASAGLEPIKGAGGPNGERRSNPPAAVPPDTYGELRALDGEILATVSVSGTSAAPQLPADLIATTGGRFFTTGPSSGDGDWRVFVRRLAQRSGDSVVVAAPTADVAASLHHLVVIEVVAALGLLALLGAGAWLILRRGLRPLEQMAARARSISAGDLSERVAPADERTEVGQLGLALNLMLDQIEVAFHERDATERRLRRFLSDASHELRTPLTSIQGFAELARLDGSRDQVDVGLVLGRIESEAKRMGTLVEDLLMLARLDETRSVQRDLVDLSVLAADACSDAAAVDPDRAITLDAPAPAVVRGDEGHLRQAIANLVTNALKHTAAGSPIEVAVRVEGDLALLAVRDHGPGLDPQALEHVFDRFWQADEARAGIGAGLGLAIVAGIAEEHGGAARAENVGDGGARFTLRLPRDHPVATGPA